MRQSDADTGRGQKWTMSISTRRARVMCISCPDSGRYPAAGHRHSHSHLHPGKVAFAKSDPKAQSESF